MIYPQPGGYSMGGGDPNDLEERKRQLVQKLLQSGSRNQTGLSGLHALPLYGGRGRGSSDLPNAALPAISFNPFLAMAAGRGQEQFQAPNGTTMAALAQAQAGMRGPIGGPAPQEIQGGNPAPQDPGLQAAQAFLGQAGATPGLDGPGAVAPAPMFSPAAGQATPDGQYSMPQAAPRHLTQPGGTLPQLLPTGWAPRYGSTILA